MSRALRWLGEKQKVETCKRKQDLERRLGTYTALAWELCKSHGR